MKKKCTNSSCRRTFFYRAAWNRISCPYCGKEYPRLGSTSSRYLIFDRGSGKYTDLSAIETFRLEGQKVKAVKYFRDMMPDCSLIEAVRMIRRIWDTGTYPLEYIVNHNHEFKITKW